MYVSSLVYTQYSHTLHTHYRYTCTECIHTCTLHVHVPYIVHVCVMLALIILHIHRGTCFCSVLQIRVAVTPSEGLTVTNPIVTLVDDTGTVYSLVCLFVYCLLLLLLCSGSTTITGSDGLQSYTVQVTAMQTGSSQETLLTSVVTTPPGRESYI